MKNELKLAKSLVESMSDPAVLLDSDLKPIAFSPAYPGLAGLRVRQLMRRVDRGGSIFEILGSDAARDRENALACMESNRTMQFAEEEVTNSEQRNFVCYMNYLPISDIEEKRAVGVIQMIRDVSAEARMQGRYKELLEEERFRAEKLEKEVQARTKDLSSALEEVTRLSKTDPLTSLLNRRAFTELAEQSIKMARRHNRTVGLLLGDLDFFKKVNDTFGHQVGDELLVATSKILQDSVRDTDAVARFGGEEFIVLLTETENNAVPLVGERMRAAVESLDFGSDGPKPTMSMGMAFFPEHGADLDELVSSADTALYAAKESGRNKVLMYTRAMLHNEKTPAKSTTVDRRRILVTGGVLATDITPEIHENFEVVIENNDKMASKRCARDHFDSIIAFHKNAEDANQLLRITLRDCPEALRVMVLDSADILPGINQDASASIDSYLIRDEAYEHLLYALEDGLNRQEHAERKKIFASESIRNLFASRVRELEKLIEESALDYAYQPIVDPRTGDVFAYESLCRARHPIFSNPSVLFEAAQQAGYLWELGRVGRKRSTDGLCKLPKDSKLFVNLHPSEMEDPEVMAAMEDVDTSRIVFEITERAAIPDYDRFRKIMSNISKQGIQFAIDDLGAGYASLNAVAMLEPEFVKIDMLMIRDIQSAPRRAKLVKRVVDFANDVGIKVIAEGIETKEEAAVVSEIGCHLAQGYYYGRPKLLDD